MIHFQFLNELWSGRWRTIPCPLGRSRIRASGTQGFVPQCVYLIDPARRLNPITREKGTNGTIWPGPGPRRVPRSIIQAGLSRRPVIVQRSRASVMPGDGTVALFRVGLHFPALGVYNTARCAPLYRLPEFRETLLKYEWLSLLATTPPYLPPPHPTFGETID